MTRPEINTVLRVLVRIKDPDEQVALAIAILNKQIAMYDSKRGQLRDMYETDSRW